MWTLSNDKGVIGLCQCGDDYLLKMPCFCHKSHHLSGDLFRFKGHDSRKMLAELKTEL